MSLEIFKNRTKSSYTIKNNKIIVKLKIATNVAVDESETNINVSNQAGIMKVQNFANHALAQGITDVVKKVQTEYSSDIFGFGDTIHKKDYKTWRKLKGNWDQTIKNVEVQVEPKFIITNTSSTKKM